MLLNGEKWACEACVRGHRVTTCKHHDRPLIRINRKGRPFATCPICSLTPCASPDAHNKLKREAAEAAGGGGGGGGSDCDCDCEKRGAAGHHHQHQHSLQQQKKRELRRLSPRPIAPRPATTTTTSNTNNMSNTASSQSGSVSTLPAPSSSSTPDPAITQPLQMETTLSLPCNTELYNPSISTAISASGISSSYPVFTSTSISDSMPMSMPMSMSIPPLFMEMGTHFFDANADAHATDETERMYADFESAFAESSAMYSFSAEEMLFQDTVGEGEGESETGAGAGAGWGWLDPDDETMLAHPAGL